MMRIKIIKNSFFNIIKTNVYISLIQDCYMVSLSNVAEDFRKKSSNFGLFELQVFHLENKNNKDKFLLIGVNESNSDAVSVFEDWENNWRESITRESTEVFDEYNNIVIHEYRLK